MITEEQWNQNEAAEIVSVATDAATKVPMFVAVFDDKGGVAHELDKHLARAVAVRLVELAERLPEPPRILRRSTDIDDELKGLDQ